MGEHKPRPESKQSIASMLLTTECVISDIPEDEPAMPMGGMPGGRTTFKMSGNGGNMDPNEIFKMFFSGNGMKMGNQMGGQMGNDNDDFGFGNFGGFSGFSGFGNMGGNMGGFKNFKGRGNSQQKSYNFS